MASEETENGSENNLTITFLSNTSHKSLSTELMHHESIQTAKRSFRIRWIRQIAKIQIAKIFVSLPACLYTLIDLPPKLLGI